jgi:hypothetical protein
MSRKSLRKISLILIIALSLSSASVITVVTVPASDYIFTYNAGISKTGSSGVKVAFEIYGTRTMDDIGATSIYLYESTTSGWNLVQTFIYTQSAYSYIMNSNAGSHSASVTYAGTSGKQYYATVYLWAGRNGGGDSRFITTSTVTV